MYEVVNQTDIVGNNENVNNESRPKAISEKMCVVKVSNNQR